MHFGKGDLQVFCKFMCFLYFSLFFFSKKTKDGKQKTKLLNSERQFYAIAKWRTYQEAPYGLLVTFTLQAHPKFELGRLDLESTVLTVIQWNPLLVCRWYTFSM